MSLNFQFILARPLNVVKLHICVSRKQPTLDRRGIAETLLEISRVVLVTDSWQENENRLL